MNEINDINIIFIIINKGYEIQEKVYVCLTWRYQVRIRET